MDLLHQRVNYSKSLELDAYLALCMVQGMTTMDSAGGPP